MSKRKQAAEETFCYAVMVIILVLSVLSGRDAEARPACLDKHQIESGIFDGEAEFNLSPSQEGLYSCRASVGQWMDGYLPGNMSCYPITAMEPIHFRLRFKVKTHDKGYCIFKKRKSQIIVSNPERTLKLKRNAKGTRKALSKFRTGGGGNIPKMVRQ